MKTKVMLVTCVAAALLAGGSSADELAARERAKATFWSAFHDGRYDDLPAVIEALTRAYLDDPKDAETTLLLAHAHLWAASESSRAREPRASIIDELILAERFLDRARALSPDDARIPGWLAGVNGSLARIHGDSELAGRAAEQLAAAAKAYPAFNDFSAFYVMTGAPRGSAREAAALALLWRNIDVCSDREVHHDADARHYRSHETTHGPQRVCWNSDLAPHNYEGFWLAGGDLMSASGDAATARRLYENAKLSKTYATWPYRGVLEERIRTVEDRTRRFGRPESGSPPELMVHSAYSCSACHASR